MFHALNEYDLSNATQVTIPVPKNLAELKDAKGMRGFSKKLFNSATAKEALGEPDYMWIYDGNKLAW